MEWVQYKPHKHNMLILENLRGCSFPSFSNDFLIATAICQSNDLGARRPG
jgi:hypothetical protein